MDGLLNVYKERGFTSHDVVAKLRGILKQKKIGHTGTLDPEAEGVLPVCLGKATKVCGLLTDKEKEYRAVLLLGTETDTQDIFGTVLKRSVLEVDEEAVREAIMSFVGEYDQIPPMYSALKVEGKKLYELARQGKEVERQPRRVTIYKIIIEEVKLPRVAMTIGCSKGTYIRTLCHDIGRRLDVGGCMESLVRTRVADFYLEHAKTLEEIEAMRNTGTLERAVTAVDTLFLSYPAFLAAENEKKRLYNGNPVRVEALEQKGRDSDRVSGTVQEGQRESRTGGVSEQCPERIRVYDSEGRFIGIYSYDGKRNAYRPETLFFMEQAATKE
ncbi:MAG: tRNA pseudouridine(55) synthase TruB [Lachnospiraceae bacterium]|nr:tRNA pseudouridine(55) synthase TruB [Lachnospiraceae bacterium]